MKKYRAIASFAGDVAYEVGATLFVLGDTVDGKVTAVVNGKSGMCPMDTLTLITPELLAKEKADREAALAAASEQAEKERLAFQKEMEAELTEELSANKAELDAAPTLEGEDDTAKAKRIAAEKAEAKAAEEREASRAEEDKLKAEAARLEELMRQLDMSSDEED